MLGNIGHLLSRSRVLLRSVLIGLILALSFGFGSSAAWAQCNESATLLAAGAAANDQFGQSVAMSGDVVVVGNYLDDDRGTNSGSAMVVIASFIGVAISCGAYGYGAGCSDGFYRGGW